MYKLIQISRIVHCENLFRFGNSESNEQTKKGERNYRYQSRSVDMFVTIYEVSEN